jgi:menaquinol-cytochrome c reductase iron-sulfur subunit
VDEPAKAPYTPPPRRQFFKYLVNGIGAAIALILALPLGGFFALPALRKREPVWKEVGPTGDFAVGEIKVVPLKSLGTRRWPEDWGKEAAWVYRKSEDLFVVYDMHCTHVGCPVNWSAPAKRFFCPCHGGVFDADGRVLAGPPPRPLDRYEVRVENGVVYAGAVRPAVIREGGLKRWA